MLFKGFPSFLFLFVKAFSKGALSFFQGVLRGPGSWNAFRFLPFFVKLEVHASPEASSNIKTPPALRTSPMHEQLRSNVKRRQGWIWFCIAKSWANMSKPPIHQQFISYYSLISIGNLYAARADKHCDLNLVSCNAQPTSFQNTYA